MRKTIAEKIVAGYVTNETLTPSGTIRSIINEMANSASTHYRQMTPLVRKLTSDDIKLIETYMKRSSRFKGASFREYMDFVNSFERFLRDDLDL